MKTFWMSKYWRLYVSQFRLLSLVKVLNWFQRVPEEFASNKCLKGLLLMRWWQTESFHQKRTCLSSFSFLNIAKYWSLNSQIWSNKLSQAKASKCHKQVARIQYITASHSLPGDFEKLKPSKAIKTTKERSQEG